MHTAITASMLDRGLGLSIRQPRRLWRATASDARRANAGSLGERDAMLDDRGVQAG
jgi:hypothetical protein